MFFFRTYFGLIVASLLSLVFISAVSANDFHLRSLQGLKGVYVSVEMLDPVVEKEGLTRNRIKEHVESKLKREGIRVYSKKEWFDIPGSPSLYINAHLLKLQSTKEYVYSINVALKQDVYLAREPLEIPGAITLSMGTITGISPNLDKILSSIEDKVDEFIRNYRSANSK